MRLYQPDYIRLVIGAYKKGLANGSLSVLLNDPTRTNIKQECLNVYDKRKKNGEKEERNTLTAFFGEPPGNDLRKIMEDCGLDKFRPVQSLIKDKIKTPALASVELLAWLIDFRHRPFSVGMDVVLDEDERALINDKADDDITRPVGPESPGTTGHGTPPEGPGTGVKEGSGDTETAPRKFRSGIAGILIGTCFLLLIYIFWRERSRQLSLADMSQGCMYWTGTNYEAMPCSEDRKDRLKLPLDTERMRTFKRIMQEDTITERSIGKVYYIRINGGIEYYTTGGKHPVYVTKNLQKLSRYMFDKHLKKDEITQKAP